MQCALPQNLLIPAKKSSLLSSRGDGATMAVQLFQISNHKLRKEASQTEPRLRKLLGHISVYDSTRIAARGNVCSKRKLSSKSTEDDMGVGEVFSYTIDNQSQPAPSSAETDLSTNSQQQTKSAELPSALQDFKAALDEQLQLVQQLSHKKQPENDPFSDGEQYEDSDDSDYSDSTLNDDDVSWEADDDSDNESDESLTDTEIMDAEIVPPEDLDECGQWTGAKFQDFRTRDCNQDDDEDDDDEELSIQPLVVHFSMN